MIKKEGFVEFAVALFVIFMLAIMIRFTIDSREMRLVDTDLEDSLTSAVLASAVVDLDEYGTTQEVMIDRLHGRQSEGKTAVNGINVAYNNFIKNFVVSLGAENKTEYLDYKQSVILNDIRVEMFHVYNVSRSGEVSRIEVPSASLKWQEIPEGSLGADGAGTPIGSVGIVKTPDGELVQHTTVYVKISYEIRAFNGDLLPDRGSRDYKVAIYEKVE